VCFLVLLLLLSSSSSSSVVICDVRVLLSSKVGVVSPSRSRCRASRTNRQGCSSSSSRSGSVGGGINPLDPVHVGLEAPGVPQGRFLSRPEPEPWDSDPRLARVERELEAAPALTVLVDEVGVPE
jgi:hypothetical protein